MLVGVRDGKRALNHDSSHSAVRMLRVMHMHVHSQIDTHTHTHTRTRTHTLLLPLMIISEDWLV